MNKEYIEEITIANVATNYPGIGVSIVRDYMTGHITNANRIRAMTDEGLADFLYATWKEQDEFSKDVCKRCPDTSCQPKCWLDWLRQEVKKDK